ncbi:MAG: hypothetical protein MHM6MM_007811 [Cercozoa sp. M6MM]
MASGVNHALAIDSLGHLWTWGVPSLGQRVSRRVRHKWLAPRRADVGRLRFDKVWCGFHSNFALSRDGRLYSWGQNVHMQTGHVNEGAMTVIAAPTEVEFAGDSDVEIADVAPASHHTVVLDKQGGVWTFGRNASGELARRTPRPELSEEERALLQGRSFVKEPLQSAQATPIDWTGGRAGDDEDVVPSTSLYPTLSPLPPPQTAALEARVSDVASERRVRQIGAGESRSFFVTKDGSLWAAGFAGEYALGNLSGGSSMYLLCMHVVHRLR